MLPSRLLREIVPVEDLEDHSSSPLAALKQTTTKCMCGSVILEKMGAASSDPSSVLVRRPGTTQSTAQPRVEAACTRNGCHLNSSEYIERAAAQRSTSARYAAGRPIWILRSHRPDFFSGYVFGCINKTFPSRERAWQCLSEPAGCHVRWWDI